MREFLSHPMGRALMQLPDVHKGDWLACKTVGGSWVPKIAAKDGIHRAEVKRDWWPVVAVESKVHSHGYINWPAEDVIVLRGAP